MHFIGDTVVLPFHFDLCYGPIELQSTVRLSFSPLLLAELLQ